MMAGYGAPRAAYSHPGLAASRMTPPFFMPPHVPQDPTTSHVEIPPLICIPMPIVLRGSEDLAINSPPGAIRCVGNEVFNQCGFQEMGDRCTNRTLSKFCHWHNPSGMFNETQHATAHLLTLQYAPLPPSPPHAALLLTPAYTSI